MLEIYNPLDTDFSVKIFNLSFHGYFRRTGNSSTRRGRRSACCLDIPSILSFICLRRPVDREGKGSSHLRSKEQLRLLRTVERQLKGR